MPKITLTASNAANGAFFRLSTKSKPDRILMERVPGQSHLHRVTFTLEEWRAIQADLALHAANSPHPLSLDIEILDEDLTGGDQIAELKTRIADAVRDRDAIATKLEEVASAQPAASTAGALTEEQLAFLSERDAMMELLIPCAQEDDTPLTALRRVIDAYKHRPPTKAEVIEDTDKGSATTHEDVGSGYDPGAAGHELQGRAKKPEEPKPFDPEEFRGTIKDKTAAELKGLAAPLGIDGYSHMSRAKLIAALTEAEQARCATAPEGPPHNTARPDGETVSPATE